ncbi:hypothetical protein QWZ08_07025 [Ferruginibacter paludis]|uniref:hypothetical protein n=1 Tax=Ferruginibacter paludis TaxID=1310417 RepID=UPI0025B47F02|nr:hypothetical protein [Ferruginibacter paludis]MDN3655369.1 hypothetical protein [Ferruginibacter paludis]
MGTKMLYAGLLLASASLFTLSCQKQSSQLLNKEEKLSAESLKNKTTLSPSFDLNVRFYGSDDAEGHLKFRQDRDPAKIIDLDIEVHLQPNHAYLLQRAVDAINVVDGNCTSASWLTLGKGLTPQSIFTDENGDGREALWRDVTAIPSGSAFDIHFQVIDAGSLAVVLTSDCYQYKVR